MLNFNIHAIICEEPNNPLFTSYTKSEKNNAYIFKKYHS